MTDTRTTVAGLIGEVDPGNTLDASTLGAVLGQQLAPHYTDLYAGDVQRYVVEFDQGRRMTAVGLATAVVDHFRLDQEI